MTDIIKENILVYGMKWMMRIHKNYDATPQTIMLESIRDDIFCQTN